MKIAIYSQLHKEEYDKTLLYIFMCLDGGDSVFLEKNLWCNFSQKYKIGINVKPFSSVHDLDSSFDLMITVGGDGTILNAMTYIQHHNIPILGINVGRMGFLATIEKDGIQKMFELIRNKQYSISNRSILEVVTQDNKKVDEANYALNEVTIRKKNIATMITVKAKLNGIDLTSYWADGLLISTPTGSTGYSLSNGGPIMMPDTQSFLINPISAHNLNVRPLVISNSFEIELEVISREDSYFMTFDSRILSLPCSTKVKVIKADFELKMVEFGNQTDNFIKSLHSKLYWNSDVRN